MSDEQTNCERCNARILVLTAREHGGLCVPCARGERDKIEARKRFFKSAEWRCWERLLHINYLAMFGAEQQFFAVGWLSAGFIMSPGFEGFFAAGSALRTRQAARGLEAMDAMTALAILQEAVDFLPAGAIESEMWDAEAVQRRVDDPIASRELSTLYMRYWTETEPYIWKSLRTFGKRNGLFDCEDGAAA